MPQGPNYSDTPAVYTYSVWLRKFSSKLPSSASLTLTCKQGNRNIKHNSQNLSGTTEALRISASDATNALVAAFKKGSNSNSIKAYILSGYPRNTADLLNYLDRLER